jgi:sulfur carrier protein ThiS
MIQVHVRLYGALRDKLPPQSKGQTVLDLPDGADIAAVLNQLSLRRHIQVAINGEIVENIETNLIDGDRVEVFRPAAGG